MELLRRDMPFSSILTSERVAMNVNLTKIRCLIAVGETLSFRAASERLNLSQPAVSNHIRDLELSLGITLFKRTTRNVVLTPDGENFLIRSRSAISALDDAMRDIMEQRAVRSGRVNFGCVPSMARLFVPAALSRFSKRYPNVKIQLFDELADRLFKRTLDYEIDFMIGPAAPSRLGLHFTHLMDDRYVAVVPAGHVLAPETHGDDGPQRRERRPTPGDARKTEVEGALDERMNRGGGRVSAAIHEGVDQTLGLVLLLSRDHSV